MTYRNLISDITLEDIKAKDLSDLPQDSWNYGSKEAKNNPYLSFPFMEVAYMKVGRLHLMLDHQIDRGVL